jgi:phosphoribosylglycinamide formyltransferase 1
MDRIRTGDLPVELSFVLSNNSKAGALERARLYGAPAYHVSAVIDGGQEAAAARMLSIIKTHSIDLLVLAGYMKKVPPPVQACLPNRIVNIHPALLPAFGGAGHFGRHVHEAVIARGCQYTGVTIHMVNEAYDEGQIILQRAIPVRRGQSADQLATEVLKLEHAYYWQVIRAFALGDIKPTASADPLRAVDLGEFPDRTRGHG